MVIEDIYLHSFPGLFLEDLSEFGPCLVIAENVELEAYEALCLFYAPEYRVEGVSPLIEKPDAVALSKMVDGYLFYRESVEADFRNSSIASDSILSSDSLYFGEKCIRARFLTFAFLAISPAILAVR